MTKLQNVQNSLGVKADDKWGAKSQAALDSEIEASKLRRSTPQPTATIDSIVDIYRLEPINFDKAVAGGLTGLIHKATQGEGFRDNLYHDRKKKAKERGILFGSYHFATGSDVEAQVRNYLDYAQPESDELIALDYEPNTSGGATMTISQARDFVNRVFDKLGRYPVIYSGHLIRETLNSVPNDILSNCQLWYAKYGPLTNVPALWPNVFMHQYTDGSIGGDPKIFPGIGKCDRNRFFGTLEQLKEAWVK